VALVGPSGAGKTTVTNLLFRFLDPEHGRVTIGGHDVREYRQEDVRRMFALAGQEAHLFSTTIRENLRLARTGASDDELWVALRRAHVADWVESLPDGLDTFVGEDGSRLSGGQRQRLVLARALLVDAPVLVLDEPTAHLDGPTAQALVDDALDAAGARAVLLITHRPEGLERMDALRGGADLVRLDAVGGTMLLIRADLHREGLVFPAFPYGRRNRFARETNPLMGDGMGEVETEGLGLMAKDMGHECWGMPNLEIVHPNR